MARAAKQEQFDLAELAGLDDLLEHRVRLAICVLLTRDDAFTFTRFKEALDETDGSLGAHLRRLEDAGYLSVERTYRNRRAVSWYRLSAKGRKQLEQHLDSLARLIDRGR
jgi:DNA-binding PadR family transcriptional regulator